MEEYSDGYGELSFEVRLITAATEGDRLKVGSLLEEGADAGYNDSEALRIAALYGWTNVVCMLLENNADVHALDDEALINAATNGKSHTVRALLRFDANPYAQSGAALMVARMMNYHDTADVLENAMQQPTREALVIRHSKDGYNR